MVFLEQALLFILCSTNVDKVFCEHCPGPDSYYCQDIFKKSDNSSTRLASYVSIPERF